MEEDQDFREWALFDVQRNEDDMLGDIWQVIARPTEDSRWGGRNIRCVVTTHGSEVAAKVMLGYYYGLRGSRRQVFGADLARQFREIVRLMDTIEGPPRGKRVREGEQ